MIDASIALAWSLDDEGGSDARNVLEHVQRHGAIAPQLWTYEIANVLTLLVRRKRIEPDRADTIGEALASLGIVTVPPDAPGWRKTTMRLAAAHALSAYDASYLTLAVATSARLATLDASLHAAAVHHGVSYDD